jgi:hypothetical protein
VFSLNFEIFGTNPDHPGNVRVIKNTEETKQERENKI